MADQTLRNEELLLPGIWLENTDYRKPIALSSQTSKHLETAHPANLCMGFLNCVQFVKPLIILSTYWGWSVFPWFTHSFQVTSHRCFTSLTSDYPGLLPRWPGSRRLLLGGWSHCPVHHQVHSVMIKVGFLQHPCFRNDLTPKIGLERFLPREDIVLLLPKEKPTIHSIERLEVCLPFDIHINWRILCYEGEDTCAIGIQ